tara:strand:+ start:2471 stop:3283 length:813 start_codon:yes stop_codon:yes gene_type:complete
MKIWKNTLTLDGYDEGLIFTEEKKIADIAFIGSKPIDLINFPNLKGIFRAGIGKDNVPEKEAEKRGIIVRYPSDETIKIIFDETATFTCSLIFRMFYGKVGTIDPWLKFQRSAMSSSTLLVIGNGNIGSRVISRMEPFIQVISFDLLGNKLSELPDLIKQADIVSLHVPKTNENEGFINSEMLSFMKNGAILINTARGSIVDEESLFFEINSGRLRAAFDVFWKEPYDGKLSKFDSNQFFMTPHVASSSKDFLNGCREGLDQLILELEND